jgi:SAM-dependent methyltransferase
VHYCTNGLARIADAVPRRPWLDGAMNGWEKWNEWYRREWRPVMEWLATESGAAPGHTALDVACGTGQPAFLVARRVGPGGRVIAVDVAADMVDACGRLARAEGIDNLEVRELDMHDLRRIADASVDSVTLGFALMFSPEPVRVARELYRVMKPGARFALAVWGDPARNAFVNTMFGAIGAVLGMPPPDPKAPGINRLAPPGELESVLREAGFRDIRTEIVEMTLVSESREKHWEMFLDMGAPARRAIEAAGPERAARIREMVFAALGDEQPVRVLATPLCATGVR